jgi:hypothetical protein
MQGLSFCGATESHDAVTFPLSKPSVLGFKSSVDTHHSSRLFALLERTNHVADRLLRRSVHALQLNICCLRVCLIRAKKGRSGPLGPFAPV